MTDERNQTTGRWPRPQRLYVNVVSGDMGIFDSWATDHDGFYRLSTGQFVRLSPRQMRLAMPAEERLFARAKRAKMEATING